MIGPHATLGHNLFQVALRHRVTDIEEDREEDHLPREERSLERDHPGSSKWCRGKIEPSILDIYRVKN
jgi:hypothetical protein